MLLLCVCRPKGVLVPQGALRDYVRWVCILPAFCLQGWFKQATCRAGSSKLVQVSLQPDSTISSFSHEHIFPSCCSSKVDYFGLGQGDTFVLSTTISFDPHIFQVHQHSTLFITDIKSVLLCFAAAHSTLVSFPPLLSPCRCLHLWPRGAAWLLPGQRDIWTLLTWSA